MYSMGKKKPYGTVCIETKITTFEDGANFKEFNGK